MELKDCSFCIHKVTPDSIQYGNAISFDPRSMPRTGMCALTGRPCQFPINTEACHRKRYEDLCDTPLAKHGDIYVQLS